jgi:pSer/pThr/pTyr-binding forkhead associated (FHA) protein
MITCPRCNHSNREGSLVCGNCGHSLQGAQTAVTTQALARTGEALHADPTWGTARFGPKNELVLYIPSADKTITLLPARRTVLGRLDQNSTKVPDLDLSRYDAFSKGVSRLHAAINREDDDVLTIVDLGSANHTYVNGERLTPHDPRVLRDGDEIRLGGLTLKIYFKSDKGLPEA